jgi:hypothetical protein
MEKSLRGWVVFFGIKVWQDFITKKLSPRETVDGIVSSE